MQPKHNRKIVFGGVDLVGAELERDLDCMGSLMDKLEPLMIESGYLQDAPFLWVNLIFRYGLKNEIIPHYKRIDKKDGELPLAKELDMRVLLTADEEDPKLLKEFFEIATLDALIHAGKKYKLNIRALEERRSCLGNIPDWEYDMEKYPEILFERYKQSKDHTLH